MRSPWRYNKIAYSPEAIDELLVTLFLESYRKVPRSIILDADATDTPLHGKQEARFFHGYYNHYCTCRCTFSEATSCGVLGCGLRTSMRAPGA